MTNATTVVLILGLLILGLKGSIDRAYQNQVPRQPRNRLHRIDGNLFENRKVLPEKYPVTDQERLYLEAPFVSYENSFRNNVSDNQQVLFATLF